MRIADRYELAKELSVQYWAAKRKERSALLDAFCLTTGYNRKYALAVLRGRTRVQKQVVRRHRKKKYGQAFSKALFLLWEASGYICTERLHPFLPEILSLLEQHGQIACDPETKDLLLHVSASTVERTLATERRRRVGRRMSQTKPGTLLRNKIPIVVGQWKEKDQPGYVEIDLVSHSGEYAVGTFLWTLSVVDLCTGWSERIPIFGKGQAGVVAAMERIRQQLPFQLLGIHPDSGGEFINYQLFAWCQDNGIEFSRSRPYHKNDNAHVEQKNWTLVRRLIGYERLDTPEQLAWLDNFYTNLLRPYANCFQPVMKVVGKKTTPAGRTQRLYDVPTTPMRRLLTSGAANTLRIQPLVDLYTTISPLTLKRQIDRKLASLPISQGGYKSA